MDTRPDLLLDDALWAQIELHLPLRPSRSRRYAGRKPIPDRQILTGILLVLVNNIPWNSLDAGLGFGSGSACWQRLTSWRAAGVWPAVEATLLAGWKARNLESVCAAYNSRSAAMMSEQNRSSRIEDRPDATIRLVFPFSGGISENIARFVQEELGARLRQTIAIVPVRSPIGRSANESALDLADPGLSLLIGGAWLASHRINRAAAPAAADDLVPIASLLEMPYVLVQPAARGPDDWSSFAERARGRGPVSCATPGSLSRPHLYLEQLKAVTGIGLVACAFAGGGEQLRALCAAQTDCGIVSLPSALPFIRSGHIRALAVSSRRRLPFLPDVPCFPELGFATLQVSAWFGLYGRRNIEPAVSDSICRATRLALATPHAKNAIDAMGASRAGRSAFYLEQQLRHESLRALRYMPQGNDLRQSPY